MNFRDDRNRRRRGIDRQRVRHFGHIARGAFGLHRVAVRAFTLVRKFDGPVTAAISLNTLDERAGLIDRHRRTGCRPTHESGRGVVGSTAIADRSADRADVIEHLHDHQLQSAGIHGERQGITGFAGVASLVGQRHGDAVRALSQRLRRLEAPRSIFANDGGSDDLAIVSDRDRCPDFSLALELGSPVVHGIASSDQARLVAYVVIGLDHFGSFRSQRVDQYRIDSGALAHLPCAVGGRGGEFVQTILQSIGTDAPVALSIHFCASDQGVTVIHLHDGSKCSRPLQRRREILGRLVRLNVAIVVVVHTGNRWRLRCSPQNGELQWFRQQTFVARCINCTQLEAVWARGQRRVRLHPPRSIGLHLGNAYDNALVQHFHGCHLLRIGLADITWLAVVGDIAIENLTLLLTHVVHEAIFEEELIQIGRRHVDVVALVQHLLRGIACRVGETCDDIDLLIGVGQQAAARDIHAPTIPIDRGPVVNTIHGHHNLGVRHIVRDFRQAARQRHVRLRLLGVKDVVFGNVVDVDHHATDVRRSDVQLDREAWTAVTFIARSVHAGGRELMLAFVRQRWVDRVGPVSVAIHDRAVDKLSVVIDVDRVARRTLALELWRSVISGITALQFTLFGANVIQYGPNTWHARRRCIHGEAERLLHLIARYAHRNHRVVMLTLRLLGQRDAPVTLIIRLHTGDFLVAFENADLCSWRGTPLEGGRRIVGHSSIRNCAGDGTDVIHDMLDDELDPGCIDVERQCFAWLAGISGAIGQRRGDTVRPLCQRIGRSDAPQAVLPDHGRSNDFSVVIQGDRVSRVALALELWRPVINGVAHVDRAGFVANIVNGFHHVGLGRSHRVDHDEIFASGFADLTCAVSGGCGQLVIAVCQLRGVETPHAIGIDLRTANELVSVVHLDCCPRGRRALEHRRCVVRRHARLDVQKRFAFVVVNTRDGWSRRCRADQREWQFWRGLAEITCRVHQLHLENVRASGQRELGLE